MKTRKTGAEGSATPGGDVETPGENGFPGENRSPGEATAGAEAEPAEPIDEQLRQLLAAEQLPAPRKRSAQALLELGDRLNRLGAEQGEATVAKLAAGLGLGHEVVKQRRWVSRAIPPGDPARSLPETTFGALRAMAGLSREERERVARELHEGGGGERYVRQHSPRQCDGCEQPIARDDEAVAITIGKGRRRLFHDATCAIHFLLDERKRVTG